MSFLRRLVFAVLLTAVMLGMMILSAQTRFSGTMSDQGETLVSVINAVDGTSDFFFPSATPLGTVFTANITVTDVTFLAGWEFRITWDPNLLSIVNTGWNQDIIIPSDNVFGSYAVPQLLRVNNSLGNALQMATIRYNGPRYVNVTRGTLYQIKFTILSYGSCGIHIVTTNEPTISTAMVDPTGLEIPYVSSDAEFAIASILSIVDSHILVALLFVFVLGALIAIIYHYWFRGKVSEFVRERRVEEGQANDVPRRLLDMTPQQVQPGKVFCTNCGTQIVRQ